MQGKVKKILGLIIAMLMLLVIVPIYSDASASPDFNDGIFYYEYDVNNPGSVVLVAVAGTTACAGDVVIPEKTSNGYTVSAIGEEAFKDMHSTTSVLFPKTVKSIGKAAFKNCYALEHITFASGSSDVVIGKEAFMNDRLSTLDLSAVTWIGEGAFSTNSALTWVLFNDNLKVIDKKAFYDCSLLKYVYNSKDNKDKMYCSLPGGLVDQTVPGEEERSAIGDSAFENCSSLQNFDMSSFDKHSGYHNIGKAAFAGCTSITELVFADCFDGTGNSAFKGCTKLTRVVLGKSLTAIEGDAFNGCIALASVTYKGATSNTNYAVNLPDILTMLGDGSFAGTPIVSIYIPKSLKTIGDNVFENCTNLSSLTMPPNTKTVGKSLCAGCTSLKTVNLATITETIMDNAFDGCTSLQKISVGNNLVAIGEEAFNECSSLIEFVMPNTVVTLGQKAFMNCKLLKSVTMSPNVTSVPDKTFYNCTSLTSISIGNAADSIGSEAFGNCINLKTVKMPEDNKGLNTIGSGAFKNCEALTSIRIPEGVPGVIESTFEGCTSLTSVTLPKSLTTIGEKAFSKCSSLLSLSLPENIITVPVKMCQGCTSLKNVYLPVNIITVGDYAFADCSSLLSVTNIDKATTVGAHCFENCAALKTLTLNQSIHTVPENLCKGCTKLSQFDFTNIKEISKYAFSGCGFKSLDLRKNIVNIESYAFKDNEELETLFLPTSSEYTTVKESTFEGCENLSNCVVPTNVENFAQKAFKNCKTIKLQYTSAPSMADGVNSSSLPFAGVERVVVPFTSEGYYDEGWKNSKCNSKYNVCYEGDVTFKLTNFKDVAEADYRLSYGEYKVKLNPSSGYTLPSSIKVTYKDGTSVINYVSYDMNSGEIIIDTSSLTGQIVITAEAISKKTVTNTPTPAPTAEPVEVDREQLIAFVSRCYSKVLERDPEEAGLQGWADQLEAGSICGAHVAYGFFFSEEFTSKNVSNEEYVTILYRVFFDREPDTEGFKYWVDLLNNGKDRMSVYGGFANSQEFDNLCANYGIATGCYVENCIIPTQQGVNAFVARLYNLCFKRLPDMGGQISWVNQLINGEISGAQAGYSFFFSPEYLQYNSSNNDYVTTLYRVFMNREPDAAGLDGWLTMLNNGTDRIDVLRGFAGSLEYANICQGYGIVAGQV